MPALIRSDALIRDLASHAPADAVLPFKELVRLVVIGSVDDGKSTLIGRLLYETGSLPDDQIEQVRRATRNGESIDFSLFTDGLRAEREQGITIDVAYRYFETAARKFILADTPGHAQYTRNMATGASTADAGIILVDARLGVLPQTRRHASIAALLGIPRLAVAINKLDLIDFDEAVFLRLADEVRAFAVRLGFSQLSFFPLSARDGDNLARRSPRTPWHEGGTLLEFLETVPVDRDRHGAQAPLRFPVQTVLRAPDGARLLAGQVASGTVAPGDEVVILPSGVRARVRSIETFDGALSQASAPLSVTLRLEGNVDAGRGDLLAHPASAPPARTHFQATAVWLSDRPLDLSRAFLLKQTTRTVPARVEQVLFRLDPESLEETPAPALALNDLGRIAVRCARPIVGDAYAKNRVTGAFILIDALTNETAAAGTIVESGPAKTERARIFLVGSPGAAAEVERLLFGQGHLAAVALRPEAARALAHANVLVIYAGPPAADLPAVDLRGPAGVRETLNQFLNHVSAAALGDEP